MNGINPETRNHTKNELPLIRPTMPPASPKKNMMTISPMPPIGASLQDRLQRPEDRDHDRHGDDRPEDRHHEPDQKLDRQRHGHDQDDTREEPFQDRRPCRAILYFSLHDYSVPR